MNKTTSLWDVLDWLSLPFLLKPDLHVFWKPDVPPVNTHSGMASEKPGPGLNASSSVIPPPDARLPSLWRERTGEAVRRILKTPKRRPGPRMRRGRKDRGPSPESSAIRRQPYHQADEENGQEKHQHGIGNRQFDSSRKRQGKQVGGRLVQPMASAFLRCLGSAAQHAGHHCRRQPQELEKSAHCFSLAIACVHSVK